MNAHLSLGQRIFCFKNGRLMQRLMAGQNAENKYFKVPRHKWAILITFFKA